MGESSSGGESKSSAMEEDKPISREDKPAQGQLSQTILALHSSLLFSALDFTDSLKSTEIITT